MVKFLFKYLRRQSKPMRNNIALGIAGIFTGAVFMVWIYHTPVRLSEVSTQSAEARVGFSQLFNQFGKQISNLKQSDTEPEAGETELRSPEPDQTYSATVAPASAERTFKSAPAASTSTAPDTRKTDEQVVRLVASPAATTSGATSSTINQ
jgi:hypothetical protein